MEEGSQREWGRIYSKRSFVSCIEHCACISSSKDSEVNLLHTEEGDDEVPGCHLNFHNSESPTACRVTSREPSPPPSSKVVGKCSDVRGDAIKAGGA